MIKSTSPVTLSLSQIGGAVVFISGIAISATTWVNKKLASIENGQAQILANQERMEEYLKHELVNWQQARLFAADFRRINPTVPLPDLAAYREP